MLTHFYTKFTKELKNVLLPDPDYPTTKILLAFYVLGYVGCL